MCLIELGELCGRAGDPRPRLGPTPVVATVPSADPVVLRVAVHAAADGYVLLPDLSVETLHAALRDVAGGRRHLPEAISSFLLTWAQTGGPRLDEPTQLLSPASATSWPCSSTVSATRRSAPGSPSPSTA